MALFSMAWQKIGQITHLSICDGIDDTQICINKSMTVTFCLSQNNFCGGRFLPGTAAKGIEERGTRKIPPASPIGNTLSSSAILLLIQAFPF